MNYSHYEPDTDDAKTVTDPDARETGNAACPIAYAAPLPGVVTPMPGRASPADFMDTVDVASRQLGNRAFMRWVEALRAAGPGARPGTDAARGAQGPNCAPAHAGMLQFMPGKHRKKGKPAPQEAPQVPETAQATSAAGITDLPIRQPPPQPGAEGPAEQKKKKKSRVQVALNTLRREGVEAFGDYIEAEIGEGALLRTLVERITRAEDLRIKREDAIRVVETRLTALDPGYVPDTPPAAAPEQDTDTAVMAQVKTRLKQREIEVFRCCSNGNADKLRNVLRVRLDDINIMFLKGTPLCYATYEGHAAVVRELLSAPGIDVNRAQDEGATPLFMAAQQGHVDIAKLLLAMPGIKINLTTLLRATPLCIAAQHGSEGVARLLLMEPAIQVDVQQYDGATALFCAAQDNYLGIVEALLDKGADVNLALHDGSTPLCAAAKHGNTDVVRRLLRDPGIQVNATTKTNGTALSVACLFGHKEIARILLRKKADPNIRTGSGLSILHCVCLLKHTAIVEMLLHGGADMDAGFTDPEGKGYTAYDLAELAGSREVMSVLAAHRRAREKQQARLEKPSPGDGAAPATPPTTPPSESLTLQPAVTAALSGATASIPEIKPDSPGAGVTQAPDTTPCATRAGQPSPAAPGSLPAETGTPSAQAQAQDALRQEVLGKLRNDNLEPLEGIRLLEDVNASTCIDELCALYNRLAHIERSKERARGRGRKAVQVAVAPGPAAAAAPYAPLYSLGGKTGLDADAVEDEIKGNLDQRYHRFVSQAVNNMEFGRGKLTPGYPELWHTSAGIAGVGSCSVFYYLEGSGERIRVVGTGHHVDHASYRLNYASGELGGPGRILRLS